jgi:acyl homoserine lactone synthase
MTTVAMGSSTQLNLNVMRLLDQFRHDVFVKRLGWSLPMMNGVERDQYDTADAQYVVLSDGAERVTACARLLPTTGKYMLPDLFPELLGDCAAPKDAAVWELSRFATSVRETREGRVLSLSKPTLELLDLVYDHARTLDVARLVLVTSIGIERLMLRAGVRAHRLGPPSKVDGNLCVALFIEVPAQTAVELTIDSDTREPELEACV